jgi:cytochrome c553
MLAAILFTVAATAHAQQGAVKDDIPRAQKYVSLCNGCHGIPGYRTAFPRVYSVPRIAGQNAAYIVKALEEYKSGARDFPTMQAIASSLSPQDMAALAAYYSAGPR